MPSRIVANLEQTVRPQAKTLPAEKPAGKINRAVRHHGTPCSGINFLRLWMARLDKWFCCTDLEQEYVWNRAYGRQDIFATAGDYETNEHSALQRKYRFACHPNS